MFTIFCIVFVILCVVNPIFRFSISHLPLVVFNAFIDIKDYVKFKKWRQYENYGRMNIYIADEAIPFGSGKTLNMVHDARAIFNNYNDVDVYNFDAGCWVRQYVHIISNIKLFDVPFVPLESTCQISDLVNMPKDNDIHIYVILIDELGRLFNNRDWKTNLSPDLLGALLQQRKNKLMLLGTVQDFSLFDATLRKLSSVVYVCRKKWRFLVRDAFLASDIERSGYDFRLLTSRGSSCKFATDRLYNSYDTHEVVQDLSRSIIDGKQLSNYEILQNSITNLPYVPRARKKKKRSA